LVLEWEPKGGVYVVMVPELRGCRTHGSTLVEAARHGQEAYESWVDAARTDNDPLPAPKYFDLDGSNPPGWRN